MTRTIRRRVSVAVAAALVVLTTTMLTPDARAAHTPDGSPGDGHPVLTPVDGKDALTLVQGDPNDGWWGSVPAGYSQKEYFLEGAARTYPGDTDERAPYKTRIVVRAPVAPERFNGTVVVEWLHSVGEAAANYHDLAPEIIRRGYAWVGVTVEEQATTYLQARNPLRYGSLVNPGQAYRYDTFSQVGWVLKQPGEHDPLAALRTDTPDLKLIGTVVSGGGSLDAYVENGALRDAAVYDGMLPSDGVRFTYNAGGADVDVPSVPTIMTKPEGQAVAPPPFGPARYTGDLFRLWWVAGASHRDWYGSAGQLLRVGSALPISSPADLRNDRLNNSYGELPASGGPCNNFFPKHYAYSAALRALDIWVRTGVPAPSAPEFDYDATGALMRDADMNGIGGLRIAPIDVPVSRYIGTDCEHFGTSIPFTDAELLLRYPTHRAYVDELSDAVAANVADGFMLREDADDLLRRAEAIWFRWGVVQP